MIVCRFQCVRLLVTACCRYFDPQYFSCLSCFYYFVHFGCFILLCSLCSICRRLLEYIDNRSALTVILAYYSLHMLKISVISTLSEFCSLPPFTSTSISYKSIEIVAIWEHFQWFLAILFSHVQNDNFQVSCNNSDNAVVFSDPDFLQESNICTITKHLPLLWAIFLCVCAEKASLVLWIFLSLSFSVS